MAYCNRNDLVRRFGAREIDDLLDRNLDSADDTGTLDAVIADADSRIKGYLAGRYALPILSSVPALRHASCDITRYLLWDDNAPEEVDKRYKLAIELLEQYRDGDLVLVDEDGNPLAAPNFNQAGGVEFYAEPRVFSRETLRGY